MNININTKFRILASIIISVLFHVVLFYYFNNNTVKKKEILKIQPEKIEYKSIKYILSSKKRKKEKKKKRKSDTIKKIQKKNKSIKTIQQNKKNLVSLNNIVFDLGNNNIEQKINNIQQNKLIDIKAINKLDDITKKYINLYGNEYFKFSVETKKFLNKNLKTIAEITQFYLKYPNIAIKMKQQGTNIVQFFLYPNGDIKNVKITSETGYNSLDKNSIRTINIAYKDYPLPKEKTKIIIYITYYLK